MSRPDDLGGLEGFEFTELERIVERFSRAWEISPASARIEDHLPERPGFRLVVICELIKIDMENRWRRERPIYLEEYLARFGELQQQSQDISRLVFEEFRIRHALGHNPQIHTYQRRFAEQFEALKNLVAQEQIPLTDLPGDATSASDSGTCADIRVFSAGDVLDKRYKLIKKIGKGTFGEVWKASESDGELVAIKIPFKALEINETRVERDNLDKIERLKHEFLLETKKYWVERGYLFIVMELAEQGTLKDCLDRYREQGKQGLPVSELLQYFHDAAQALDFLHSTGMIHRDIKPHNILLVGDKAKLADFGLARQLRTDMSQTNAEGGSLAYMAPEMMQGKVGLRSDQFCFAVTYVELRQGRLPFRGSIVEMVKRDNPDLQVPPMTPQEREVLLQALAKDPRKRFRTCSEFVKELAGAVQFSSDFKRTQPVKTRTPVTPGGSPVKSAPPMGPGVATQPTFPAPSAPPSANPSNRREPPHVPNPEDTDDPGSKPGRITVKPPATSGDRHGTILTSPRVGTAPSPPAVKPVERPPVAPPEPALQPEPKPERVRKEPARPAKWKKFLLPLPVVALFFCVWYFPHMGVKKEFQSFTQRGEFENALRIVDDSWSAAPSRPEWRKEIEDAWWSKLSDDKLPANSDVKTLQKRQRDLFAFREAFKFAQADHEPSKTGLQANETAIAGKARELIDLKKYAAAEDAISNTAKWIGEGLREELACALAVGKHEDKIEGLIRGGKFPAAIRELTAQWCQENVKAPQIEKVKAPLIKRVATGWSVVLQDDETPVNLSELIVEHAKFRAFQEEPLMRAHQQMIEPGLQKNEKAIVKAIESGAKAGKVNFPEAMTAIACVRNTKVAKELRDVVQKKWLAKFDVGGQRIDRYKLVQLEKELAEFEKNFGGQVGVEKKRADIQKRINDLRQAGGLLEIAEEELKNHQYAACLYSIKDIKESPEKVEQVRAEAEKGLSATMAEFSRTRNYDELDKCLKDLDGRGIVFESAALKNSLTKYQLEAAWQPLLKEVVSTKESREWLKKIQPAVSPDSVEDKSYKALAGLLDAHEKKTKGVGDLVKLAKVASAPAGYQSNLLTALARLERKQNVFTSEDLFALEKIARALPEGERKTFHEILDPTLERLITKEGWTPNKWEECREFCDAVVAVAKPNKWIRALHAECKVELADKVPLTETDFDASWYGTYVEARIREEQRLWPDAANVLGKQKELPEALKSPYRIERYQKLLRTAAAELPRTKDPHKKMFETESDAELAYNWLTLANRPNEGKDCPDSAKIDMLLAAAKKKSPDHELVRQLATTLLEAPDKLGSAAYPLLTCYVDALSAEQFKGQRFDAYAGFLKIVKREDLRKVNRADFDEKVLEPGVALGLSMVKDDQRVKLPLAKLLVARGRARADLLDRDWKKLEGWADDVIMKYAPQYWGGYALKGSVLLQRAREEKGVFPELCSLDQIKTYIQAKDKTDEALKLAEQGDQAADDEKALMHWERSMQELELGNYLHFYTFENHYSERIKEAAKHAELAEKLFAAGDRSGKGRAWHAIANAHEDLARFVHKRDTGEEFNKRQKEFEIAQKAFDKAKDLSADPTYALIGKSRCEYWWAKSLKGRSAPADAAKAKELLVEAKQDLQAALAGASEAGHKVEGLLCLAKVLHELDEQPDAVQKHLEEAISIEKKNKIAFFAEVSAAEIAWGRALTSVGQKKSDWLALAEKYLKNAEYRDLQFVADFRRLLVKDRLDLAISENKTPENAIVADVFKELIPKEPTAFDAPTLLYQLKCYLPSSAGNKFGKYLSEHKDAITQGKKAAELAQRMASKSELYPKEQAYWLACRHDAHAAVAQGLFFMWVGKLDTAPKTLLDDAIEQAEKSIALQQSLAKFDVPFDKSRPYLAKGYASYAMYRYVDRTKSAYKKNAKEALEKSLQLVPEDEKKVIRGMLEDLDNLKQTSFTPLRGDPLHFPSPVISLRSSLD